MEAGKVYLEYWNGEDWVEAGGPFYNEHMAWISLGDDNENYRTVMMYQDEKVILQTRTNGDAGWSNTL